MRTTRGNPEIEQTEAPVREVEEVFDRRDCRVSVLLCLIIFPLSIDLILLGVCFTNSLVL